MVHLDDQDNKKEYPFILNRLSLTTQNVTLPASNDDSQLAHSSSKLKQKLSYRNAIIECLQNGNKLKLLTICERIKKQHPRNLKL